MLTRVSQQTCAGRVEATSCLGPQPFSEGSVRTGTLNAWVSGSAFRVNLTKPRVILEEGTSIGIPQIILACIHGRERLS